MPMSVNDVYAIVNTMLTNMYGSLTSAKVKAIDNSTFMEIGQTVLSGANGVENTFNALSLVLAKTIIGVRPYKGNFQIITKNEESYGYYTRKISFFTKNLEAAASEATDLNESALADGSSVDHYTINKYYPLEVNFKGSKALQKSFTRFRWQIKKAFQSESDFSKFVTAFMTEIANEIEMTKEAENRATIISYMGAVYQSKNPNMCRNMLREFELKFGFEEGAYNSKTLFSDPDIRDVFLNFVISEWKLAKECMKLNTTLYHQTPVKNDEKGTQLTLLRHTPESKLKALAFEPYFIEAENMASRSMFRTKFDIPDHEKVMFWQSSSDPRPVYLKNPVYFDSADGLMKKGTEEIAFIPVAFLFDEDGVGVNYQVEDVVTTPVNAKGEYVNTFIHWRKNYWADLTENAILFYIPYSPHMGV